ncbi:MAG: hypothetical protein RLY70_1333 [Planctomycetota bacterium]
MKFLIDMNLSPRWRAILHAEGWDSVHCSQVGVATAPDHEVMQWALADKRIVLTHDLDYGAMLAATQATGPSVARFELRMYGHSHWLPYSSQFCGTSTTNSWLADC